MISDLDRVGTSLPVFFTQHDKAKTNAYTSNVNRSVSVGDQRCASRCHGTNSHWHDALIRVTFPASATAAAARGRAVGHSSAGKGQAPPGSCRSGARRTSSASAWTGPTPSHWAPL
jgi:hypothetical protein